MTRKTERVKGSSAVNVVQFHFENRTYQIDPARRKVYRSFVEIETSKACEIYSLWRARSIQV